MVSILQKFMVKKGIEKNKYAYIFDGGHFFKIEKILWIYKKIYGKKILYQQNFLYPKKFCE